jgi:hypothetical protein
MVSGIVVEQEQIGPKRYIATLGVLFDRSRTGQLLGVGGVVHRSAPMLVIPVMVTGGASTSFEYRNEWQKAWARFRTGNSPVDYVRPTGSGIDPLLLNVMQARPPRPRLVADAARPIWRRRRGGSGGAPEAAVAGRPGDRHLHRASRPRRKVLGTFTLRVENSAAIPKLLDEGVQRLDSLYSDALATGALRPDPTLAMPPPPPPPEEAAPPPEEAPVLPVETAVTSGITTFSIQVDTPDADSVQRAELAVSRVRESPRRSPPASRSAAPR